MVALDRARIPVLHGLLLVATAACAFPGYRGSAPPGSVERRAVGCYDVSLAGWTEWHADRLGFAPPAHIELNPREVTSRDFTGTDVEGFDPNQGGAEGRLVLPTDRDLDSRWWTRSPATGPDSVFLAWYGPAGGFEVGLAAVDSSSRGTLRFVPERFTDDLGIVRLSLTTATCDQPSS